MAPANVYAKQLDEMVCPEGLPPVSEGRTLERKAAMVVGRGRGEAQEPVLGIRVANYAEVPRGKCPSRSSQFCGVQGLDGTR